MQIRCSEELLEALKDEALAREELTKALEASMELAGKDRPESTFAENVLRGSSDLERNVERAELALSTKQARVIFHLRAAIRFAELGLP
ncbi:TPA: hypothetical protein L4V00_000179 [Pseudomonas aeruginosa]|nr:hypothetical protein [Pseudomonas aeruginosa]HBO4702807.1 hypothetical protein [Pseudomonas aeruginosa]